MKTLTEPDFERLTAFALNELDATERASIEAQLQNDPQAQAYVNDVRATAVTLENELKQERLEDLARSFKPAAKPVAAPRTPREVVKPRSNLFAYSASAAAMVMLGVVIWQGYRHMESPVALQYNARLANKKNADSPSIVLPSGSNENSEPTKNAPVGLERKRDEAKSLPSNLAVQPADAGVSRGKSPSVEFPEGLYQKKADSEPKGDKNGKTGRTIKVDEKIAEKAALGDHFETINIDRPIAPPTNGLAPVVPKDKEKDVAAKDPSIQMWAKTDSKPDDKKEHQFFGDAKEVKKPAVSIGVPDDQISNMKKELIDMRPAKAPAEEGKKATIPGLVENPAGTKLVPPPQVGSIINHAINIDANKPETITGLDPNPPPASKPASAPLLTPEPAKKEYAAGDLNYYIKGHNAKITPNEDAPVVNTPPPAAPKSINKDPNIFDGLNRKLDNNIAKIQPNEAARVANTPPPTVPTKPASRTIGMVDDSRNITYDKALKNDFAFDKLDPAKKDKSWGGGGGVGAGKPNGITVAEFEAMKAELARLRAEMTANPPVPGLVDKAMDHKYGPYSIPAAITIPPGFEGYRQPTQPGGETYAIYPENAFKSVRQEPLSTFSADVDTASYSNVRRFLNNNQLPPVDAVRIEEMLNYFKYNVDTLKTEGPFGVNVEGAACPWNASTRLVRVAIKAAEMPNAQRPASNLVFLIDVSGSMDDPKRLPLVKEGMKSLVKRLNANDRVAIVTYAGESGVALSPTSGAEHDRIIAVIDSLRASGGTNGGAGIQLAYASARGTFIKGGVNRVILATDGDFNIGTTGTGQLVDYVASQTPAGVYLTALGYGMGNLKDEMLQRLADKGNGNYAYIDTAEESRKVLIDQMAGTLVTVAKDVKFQVEFNPSQASGYRLIGYEKRTMAAADFNNDAKDAGEVGAGHTVTAFYEVVPAHTAQPAGVDPLKYQTGNINVETKPEPVGGSPELLTLKIRFKQPDANESKRLEFAFTDKGASFEQATTDFKFASAVALFGQILKYSNNVQSPYIRRVIDIADENRGTDEGGYRREFIQLARKASELRGER